MYETEGSKPSKGPNIKGSNRSNSPTSNTKSSKLSDTNNAPKPKLNTIGELINLVAEFHKAKGGTTETNTSSTDSAKYMSKNLKSSVPDSELLSNSIKVDEGNTSLLEKISIFYQHKFPKKLQSVIKLKY